MTDILPEQTPAERHWGWAERHGMERELYYALADPWVKNTTTRILDALLNSKITTRAQIIELGVDGLSRVRNLGTKGIAYIRQRLMKNPGRMSDAAATDAALIDDLVTEAKCMGIALKYDAVTAKDEADFRRAYEAIERRFAELRPPDAGGVTGGGTDNQLRGDP